MTPRIVIHNHLRARPLGVFRATAPARDHAHAPGEVCDCGGPCCSDKKVGLRDRYQRDADMEKTSLAIDVVYMKGGYGRPKINEARHYVVPGVTLDPRGHAPGPEFVRAELSKQPEYKAMRKDGWYPEKIEGYWKPSAANMRDIERRKI